MKQSMVWAGWQNWIDRGAASDLSTNSTAFGQRRFRFAARTKKILTMQPQRVSISRFFDARFLRSSVVTYLFVTF
ncbi:MULTISPECIES: hypothetical protein [Rhodopseudomonas]|uniref:hypothetical protein n=1 Tax=Rhodopseudomonas TaxID=1073 RepID=UPI00128E3498|nr:MULTISPECIES: hypothetical protein [Rhodopseudomonas]MDF3813459.1 hypothetical protein [Rhodopseudomonas sp. BAL398]WOK18714.1 hypothetical protein RBJ75_04075 [Rhodopseudomonas sp. BAL398]